MINNGNCESCSGMMRNQMDMRCQKNPMMGRCPQSAIMPRTDTMREKAIGMAYVPWQQFGCTYEPMQGLQAGTIFPELEKPFYGRRGMR